MNYNVDDLTVPLNVYSKSIILEMWKYFPKCIFSLIFKNMTKVRTIYKIHIS